MTTGVHLAEELAAAARRALTKSVDSLLTRQHPEGYWWGDLTADTTLESDYILLQLWMHPPVNGRWEPPDPNRIERAVRAILARQLRDGGFNIYPDGPSEISASVKAYFALKLGGIPASDPRMAALRDRILALGGMQAANSYVKINLSLFGLYPAEHAPTVPPELMLARNVIYEMSSWTRAIVIPLAIVQAGAPRPAPAGFTLDELLRPDRPVAFPNEEGLLSWRTFFLTLDRVFKLWARYGSKRLRRYAIRRAEEWILAHTRSSDGLAAIYPPMMYVMMALDWLGYPADSPHVVEAERQFFRLLTDDGERFFFQPCFSPVWDTAIAAFALGETGLADRQALAQCGDWLLAKEVRQKGDWAVKRPNVEPSGWYFEFANEFYPDIDDTAMVLLALRHARGADPAAWRSAVDRAVRWLVAMQSSDGGWAAFDVDNNWQFLNAVPFADHNAMLDPTCPDITGRVLEALVASGVDTDQAAVRRGAAYLRASQTPEGCWYGRWGVNYIYGTFLALRGLRAAGDGEREAHILRAGEWLRSIQNADGGWGESCESYEANAFVPAPSTASQTAWAILGLIASGDTDSISVRKGIEHLIETQTAEGRWHEKLATGTGFPKVFYLAYHLYRDSFPTQALATYLKARERGEGARQ